MLYFGLYVQLRRGSVAGYTTDESWAYGPKEGVEAFESITFFIRFIYAINFEHLLIGEKCKEPVISIVDNKIHITCDTKDADIYYSLKAIDNVEEAKYDEPIMPSTKYILTAYAKVDEFDVSETVSFPFTVIQEDPTKIVTIKADNDDASVAVNGKNILISTANGAMQPTIVSTTNGSLVYDGTVSGQSVIPVTQGGIYIVKAGNTTKKVLVK